jgi:hypothetical protein
MKLFLAHLKLLTQERFMAYIWQNLLSERNSILAWLKFICNIWTFDWFVCVNILTNQTTALIVFGFRCYWIKKKKWRKKKIQQTSNFNLIGRLADIWQYYNAWKPDIFLSYFHNLFCVTKRESKWQGFKYFKYFDISWQKNY